MEDFEENYESVLFSPALESLPSHFLQFDNRLPNGTSTSNVDPDQTCLSFFLFNLTGATVWPTFMCATLRKI